MTAEEIQAIATAWIANKGLFCPAWERLYELGHECPEVAWVVIQEIAARPLTDEIMAILAAGPLEDLLAKHGQLFIERIEAKAKSDQKFSRLLGGVWQNTMKLDIWDRVQKARSEVW